MLRQSTNDQKRCAAIDISPLNDNIFPEWMFALEQVTDIENGNSSLDIFFFDIFFVCHVYLTPSVSNESTKSGPSKQFERSLTIAYIFVSYLKFHKLID